jgi:hypothetical protein
MELWTCPECKRSFQKQNQMHSCTPYALSKHFIGKDFAKKLFDELLVKLEKLGKIKVESLPCCIHLVKPENAFNFAAVYATKDGLRFHIGSNEELKSNRIRKAAKMSNTKYMYELDSKELDAELLSWLKKAYELK